MNKIKLKLNGEKCQRIEQLITDCDVELIHKLITSMVNALMDEVIEKLHKHTLYPAQKCTISLTEAQALAFVLFFSHINLNLMPYESNLIRQIITIIDQQTTNNSKQLIKK